MSQVYNNRIVYTKSILCEIDISAIVSGSPTAKGETRRTSLSPTFCRKPCKSAERPGMLGPVGEYVRLLGAHLRPQWPRVLLLAVVLLGGSGLELLFPQLLRHFIDASLEGRATESLYRTGVLVIFAGLASELLKAGSWYAGADVAWRATNQLRSSLTRHVVGLDMSFHNSRTPGELIERIDGDVDTLSNFFSGFVIGLFGGIALAIGVLTVLFIEDLMLGFSMLGFSVLYLMVSPRLQQLATRFWSGERQASADFFAFIGERLPAVRDIQSSGAVDYTMRGYYEVKRAQMYAMIKALVVGASAWQGVSSIFTFALVSAMALGVYMFQTDRITIGTVYLILHYIRLLQSPLSRISSEVQDLQRARASIGRVNELVSTQSRVRDGAGVPVKHGAPDILFDEVSFSYDGAQSVLHDISFTLEQGRTLGLLGRTGSGKTTISRLLFRLYDADKGTIRLDDTNVTDMRLSDLRRRIGMVTQEVQLFNASVRDNLTLFDPTISDSRIEDSIQSLGLRGWYEALRAGLDSELTAGGSQVSAGEAQLLAFARVFLRDPDVVVMDEASSRLDPATEGLIEQAVGNLLANRTSIIIAHRLRTIQRVDDVLIIEGGRIQEYGPREDLASDRSSRLSALLRTGLDEVLA